MRKIFLRTATVYGLWLGFNGYYFPERALWSLLIAPLFLLGFFDMVQKKHAILRNFPVVGHFRYMFESIRAEINQYFVESNKDGKPFSREQRSLVYQRSKLQIDTLPFGTQEDLYQIGAEWMAHTISPVHVDAKLLRLTIGGPDCKQPYNSSVLNSSAMSFGSLSHAAVRALNGGAKDAGFAQNTGEGGLSPHHLENGGDVIWQIGTGYFSAREKNGKFSPSLFQANATRPEVKMIELKLNQGAKPGHGGILPKEKLTKEIAEIRGVNLGEDVLSPAGHSAFSTPIEMMYFISKLRDLSGGKPVGFKLCIGKQWEVVALVKAMVETGIYPDYIAVDGGEGGTGAAPQEFSNRVGFPAIEGQIFMHNILTGFNIRDRVKLAGIGKVTSAFDIAKKVALGADFTYAARAFMMSLGCIQALKCNTNECPTGVATQDPHLIKGLVVGDKRTRVKNFHSETMKSLAHLMGAVGAHNLHELNPHVILRRASPQRVYSYAELYEYLAPGALLAHHLPDNFRAFVLEADAKTFRRAA